MPFSATSPSSSGTALYWQCLKSNISDFTNQIDDRSKLLHTRRVYSAGGWVRLDPGMTRSEKMNRFGRGMRQLTALLVLTIVAAASGLPHWHPSAPADTSTSDPSARLSSSTAPNYLRLGATADLLQCVACILQRILSQVSTESAEAPPRPMLQAEVVAAPVQPAAPPLFRSADPRGPPAA